MIIIATNNTHKKQELSAILGTPLKIPAELAIPFNPIEDGKNFLENALIKAHSVWEQSKKPVIADDSGLVVDALNGEPGIHSSRYGAEEGLAQNDIERNQLLLSRMEGIKDRNARFICCMVFYLSPNQFFIAQERFEGLIAEELSGAAGFGYDPLFYIPSLKATVAELSEEEKYQLSHRAKAAKALASIIAPYL